MTPQTWCDIFRMSRAPLISQGGVACRRRAVYAARSGASRQRPLLLSGRDDGPGRGLRGHGDAALGAATATEIAFEVGDERGHGGGAGIAGDALSDRVDLQGVGREGGVAGG